MLRAIMGMAALVSTLVGPTTGETQADFVIVAGAAGLRWDDISEQQTPTLWKLASKGSIGSLVVSSAHVPTCPADGWVTLGAGNRAERTQTEVAETCPPMKVTIDLPDKNGAFLPDQQSVVARQLKLPYGAVPGALAESVRCTTAVGMGGAVAAARPFGRVDRYAATLPENPATLLSTCPLSIVDLGTVIGSIPEERELDVKAIDALLARVVAARPENSTLIVAGVSDTDRESRLHAVIVDGPGWDGQWVTSASTGRAGYLQLVDIAPTVLTILKKTVPKKIFAGHTAVTAPGRPADLVKATAAGVDADRQAESSRRVATWFFILLAAVQIILYALVVPILRRSYRHAGPTGPQPPSQRLTNVLEALLIASALAVPAALIADIVPWWRSGQRGLIFTAIVVVTVALLTLLVVRLQWSKRTLGPVGLVAGLASIVVGLDLMTGARLQLNGVAGYLAPAGGRYAGLGVVAMGVFIGGSLLTAGCVAQLVPHARRTLVVAAIGAAGVVLVGSPFLGADAGGAVALTAGVCLAAALAAGGWLTFSRMAWAVLAGLVVTIGFALIDVQRSDHQGSLGRFLNQLGEGTYALTLQRTGAANVSAFASSPLTVLAVVAAIFTWSVLLRPWGGLKRLYGIYPAVRASVVGLVTATIIAGLLAGAAFNVAGAAAATVLPLLTLGAMRVLAHSADRTRAQEPAQEPES